MGIPLPVLTHVTSPAWREDTQCTGLTAEAKSPPPPPPHRPPAAPTAAHCRLSRPPPPARPPGAARAAHPGTARRRRRSRTRGRRGRWWGRAARRTPAGSTAAPATEPSFASAPARIGHRLRGAEGRGGAGRGARRSAERPGGRGGVGRGAAAPPGGAGAGSLGLGGRRGQRRRVNCANFSSSAVPRPRYPSPDTRTQLSLLQVPHGEPFFPAVVALRQFNALSPTDESSY